MDATWIASGLWLGGSFTTAGELPSGVDVVVNVTSEPDPELPFGRLKATLWLPLEETIPSVAWLQAVTGFVVRCQELGWTVLVHCAQGVSRAPFVVAACLMRSQDWSREIALRFVQAKRGQISPHLGLWTALGDWGHYLASGRAA